MTRRSWIVLPLVAQAGCIRARQPALTKAAQYLWNQQATDGGWHSKTYGLLGSGQSLTPFVLDALLQVPGKIYPLPEAKVDRGVDFIRKNTRPDGALGMTDPGIPDYPNYSTALAVSALCRARRPGWETQVRSMLVYLRGQQFTERNGWRERDAAYGAWGMGGEPRTPPDTGHVDLSMTRYVLDALRAAGVPAEDSIFKQSRIFVERCQNSDGGFFFSTTESDINKAGHDGKQFRSYGTATADGILALLSVGVNRTDRRVLAAQGWLAGRHASMEVPGFVGEAYQRWPRGLAFYYCSAVTQVFRALGVDPGSRVMDALKRTQRADGSWANPENLVKEDDPHIATAFAVRALSNSFG